MLEFDQNMLIYLTALSLKEGAPYPIRRMDQCKLIGWTMPYYVVDPECMVGIVETEGSEALAQGKIRNTPLVVLDRLDKLVPIEELLTSSKRLLRQLGEQVRKRYGDVSCL